MLGVIVAAAFLALACWLVWRMGVPLAGSLYRARRKANRPTPYDRGAPDRRVSELESVPGHGTAEDGLDALVEADPLLSKLARKTRA